MKKIPVVLLVVLLTLSLMTTMAFAAKSIEDMATKDGCTSCHQPDSEKSFKGTIKKMAEEGRHSNVASMVSNKSPKKCKGCHTNNFGKVLHKSHLTGTPDSNGFLALVDQDKANCISCHEFNAKSGKINQ